jgi:hypothetical protein
MPELLQELARDNASGAACPPDFDDAAGKRSGLLRQQRILITRRDQPMAKLHARKRQRIDC